MFRVARSLFITSLADFGVGKFCIVCPYIALWNTTVRDVLSFI
jgi:hypothetical protein